MKNAVEYSDTNLSARGAPRLIALYLPQFHPIPENDRLWGPGFTEWTNVAAARALYREHEQPKLPGELGFYDLRLAETRSAQAALARSGGIEGFCYWHYWFAGHRIMERPFQEVLESGEPNFPFCLRWVNGDWSGIWCNAPDRVLVEQTYPGAADYRAHFEAILPALRDRRYLRVGEHPLFAVFRPMELPDPKEFCALWRELAERAGLPSLHLVGFGASRWDPTPRCSTARAFPGASDRCGGCERGSCVCAGAPSLTPITATTSGSCTPPARRSTTRSCFRTGTTRRAAASLGSSSRARRPSTFAITCGASSSGWRSTGLSSASCS
jgi:hypothetical protein